MKKSLLLFGIFLCCINLLAQDIHWSQFSDNPILLNPANSGNHDASNRFVTAYKDQWRSVTKAFQTFSLTYDTKLKNPDFSLGISFLNDQVGDGKFKTFEFNILPSYQIPLTKNKEHLIFTGLQIGLNQRNFDFSKFYFDEQYNGVTYDSNLPITENIASDKKMNLNIGAGLLYSFLQKDGSNLNLGFATYNLNRPNQGFYGEKIQRDVRFNLHAMYQWKIGEKLTALPSILFQKQGTFKEVLFGTSIRYALNPDRKNYKAIQAGIFLRMRDAIIVQLGLTYKNWYAGLSYDVNTSTLIPASSKRGGMEINLRYLWYQFKPKKIQYRICPDYI